MQYIYYLFLFTIQVKVSISKLISVIEVNRHGARNAKNFPSEPLQRLFGVNMKITHNGFRQHQLLGNYMYDRYINAGFINKEYRADEFEIISSPTQRTLFSADGFLTGLFPGYVIKAVYQDPSMNIISDDIIPIPNFPTIIKEIPLKVMSWREKQIFNDPWGCKLNGKKLRKMSVNNTEFPDIFPISREDIIFSARYLREFFNHSESQNTIIEPETFVNEIKKHSIPYFYHLGVSMEKVLPKKVSDSIKKMNINNWYNARIRDSKLLKLGPSAFFNLIKRTFNRAIINNTLQKNDKSFPKYTVFSFHDRAIINLISNILNEKDLQQMIANSINNSNYYNFLVPPFASSLLFELHYSQQKQNYYVLRIYNGKVINYPLRNCKQIGTDGKIPIEVFQQFLGNRIDKDYKHLICVEKIKDEHNNNNSIAKIQKNQLIVFSNFQLL